MTQCAKYLCIFYLLCIAACSEHDKGRLAEPVKEKSKVPPDLGSHLTTVLFGVNPDVKGRELLKLRPNVTRDMYSGKVESYEEVRNVLGREMTVRYTFSYKGLAVVTCTTTKPSTMEYFNATQIELLEAVGNPPELQLNSKRALTGLVRIGTFKVMHFGKYELLHSIWSPDKQILVEQIIFAVE